MFKGSRKLFYLIAKAKVLIRCAVNMQPICAFVFACQKNRFSHEVAQIVVVIETRYSANMILSNIKIKLQRNHTDA